jgi:hypothetical protein
MPKKKKRSGWTLKPGESVEDWLDNKRAARLAKMSEEEQSRAELQALGFADDDDDDTDDAAAEHAAVT